MLNDFQFSSIIKNVWEKFFWICNFWNMKNYMKVFFLFFTLCSGKNACHIIKKIRKMCVLMIKVRFLCKSLCFLNRKVGKDFESFLRSGREVGVF
jgi:hypothetical protein